MEKFFDPKKSYVACEETIKNYLCSLSDSQLKTLFDNLEYTPFSKLLMQEYKKRFRNTNIDR
ncbi:MAG: hypothetical protein K5798_02425 [Nitrosopumilus sp.]|uniref:hypothetical protein n=1 Tax=Nitrosopumilus sp. TaxID=2024843 RepID=UPI00242EB001|nr:hypothetical protein [Nitrosopumilus sp.]MCV0366105.1 hypothetical protein [Nitrosopumilus sp.]